MHKQEQNIFFIMKLIEHCLKSGEEGEDEWAYNGKVNLFKVTLYGSMEL
jgi:hypothetical protein